MDVRRVFEFPDPVNETSARVVATGVVVMGVAFLVVREAWILLPLLYGFAARVLTGPTASPLGQVSVRVVTPLVERGFGRESRHVPGPPKRFAQLIGLGFTAGAAVAWIAGAPWIAYVLIAGLVIAASLEAFASICLGCIAYSAIWGCADCDDISDRLQQAVVRARRPVDAAEASATTN
ncbi:DUF4395 domain-containing protein [Ilumatobacter nonamiensis]|uniref:DUF4395 domain-containing protein n=1 Tax=Ilumatobacter nonamiensis TaxID=467093 RepID=UPI00130D99AD|nr:DUF4395 domain-containing protein [Ilumatobacter nonamiensis]